MPWDPARGRHRLRPGAPRGAALEAHRGRVRSPPATPRPDAARRNNAFDLRVLDFLQFCPGPLRTTRNLWKRPPGRRGTPGNGPRTPRASQKVRTGRSAGASRRSASGTAAARPAHQARQTERSNTKTGPDIAPKPRKGNTEPPGSDPGRIPERGLPTLRENTRRAEIGAGIRFSGKSAADAGRPRHTTASCVHHGERPLTRKRSAPACPASARTPCPAPCRRPESTYLTHHYETDPNP